MVGVLLAVAGAGVKASNVGVPVGAGLFVAVGSCVAVRV